MIRIILGILIVYGVAGGIDNMPLDPSLSYILAQITVLCVGFSLALWGIKDVKK